ncbi:hypothetical protein QR77_03395 [Streptomyces sp. 150FB]|uniref:hypothetical protein n=1 Tax=Streptomyces sp. 150FB TaxID=1576605 RepID=UPI00058949FF|nr:hypothetical protein [Streptomyces sp. 150FB]KIF73266.1 hypothetical protein QR77_03395 [Streptomyces sp. 150FB]
MPGSDPTAMLREHLTTGGTPDLNRDLREEDRDRARGIRRALRPPRRQIVATGDAQLSWESETSRRALALALEHGVALLAPDVPVADRLVLNDSVRRCTRRCPEGMAVAILTSTVYRSDGGQRAKSELLLISLGGEPGEPVAADGERPVNEETTR